MANPAFARGRVPSCSIDPCGNVLARYNRGGFSLCVRAPPEAGMTKPQPICFLALLLLGGNVHRAPAAEDGVFVRFRLLEPQGASYHVALGGYIHKEPWYLPAAILPAGADRDAGKRLSAGQFTPWFNLKAHAGARLHGRMSRAGGIAEFPNVTADFIVAGKADRRTVVIELATAADAQKVVKRWQESFEGSLTSFLVSPQLARDADALESAAEMSARRLAWARTATKSKPATPSKLIVQTSFWSPQ